jgi:hypothetical protein
VKIVQSSPKPVQLRYSLGRSRGLCLFYFFLPLFGRQRHGLLFLRFVFGRSFLPFRWGGGVGFGFGIGIGFRGLPLFRGPRGPLQKVQAPFHFQEPLLEVRLQLPQFFGHFFRTYRFFRAVDQDGVRTETNGADLLRGPLAVEFLQQRAVLGRMVGDLRSRVTLPAERASYPFGDRVCHEQSSRVLRQPFRYFSGFLDAGTVGHGDTEVPPTGDGDAIPVEL